MNTVHLRLSGQSRPNIAKPVFTVTSLMQLVYILQIFQSRGICDLRRTWLIRTLAYTGHVASVPKVVKTGLTVVTKNPYERNIRISEFSNLQSFWDLQFLNLGTFPGHLDSSFALQINITVFQLFQIGMICQLCERPSEERVRFSTQPCAQLQFFSVS